MFFILFNVILTVFFIALTVYADLMENTLKDETNPITGSILLAALANALFSITLILNKVLTPSVITLFMKLCFMFEGFLLINAAFCLPYYAWKYTNIFVYSIKKILYVFVYWIVFFKIHQINVSFSNGIEVISDYLFKGNAREYFPYTWEYIFQALFKYIIPLYLNIIMLIKNEMCAIKIKKIKGYIYTSAIASLWIFCLIAAFITKSDKTYELFHYTLYIPMIVIILIGARLPSAPSGMRTALFITKLICLYVFPSTVMGALFIFLNAFVKDYKLLSAITASAGTGFVLFMVNTISGFVGKTQFGRSADYAVSFGKDLANIDYNEEMDTVAENMFKIFKKNVEASSMSVFIKGSSGIFEVAYDSDKTKSNLTQKDALFESLLNIGRNIVIYGQLETVHALNPIKSSLEKFFSETNSDALLLFNEGRSVHGFILLGIKDSKDHYREYDFNIFTKLYSYFFVFGYYMRNISNKEIIGTVNRELRMSSQIITSIQENIDKIYNNKIEAGSIMIPAHNIGGEFIDMIRLTDKRHLFVVGDLSGKGIAASMNMVILKSIIRAYLNETDNFKQLVVKVNSFIRNNLQKGTIFSGMFAIVNFENDTMYYINCGIPAMFLYTETYNNVIEIQGEGHILGFVSDISPYISVKNIKLNKSDIVLACTKGTIESHSLRGELYGKDRIQRSMASNSIYPAHRIAQFVYDDLVKFMSHEMEDDVSILVLKYLE